MKESEFKFEKSIDSVEATFMQAEGYYSDVMQLLKISKFDFLNEDEDLEEDKLKQKINEKNRRLQTLGQSFELYMKYILLASKLENNPDISLNELWGKWIKGHKMVDLIDNKADKLIPGFKDVLFKIFNSIYGIGGINSFKLSMLNGNLSSASIMEELIPKSISGFGALLNEDINAVIERNTSIYESCRYNIERPTDYNFEEVLVFISFIKFFATMIHVSENKLNIDYNLAYLKTKLQDPIIKKEIVKHRSIEEINILLNMDEIKENIVLIAYLLTHSFYSVDDIKNLISLDESLKDTNNLFSIVSKNISIDKIKQCKNDNINVLTLSSNFTYEQIKKIISIPIIGDYINNNPIILSNLLTKYQSDIGLEFDDWYYILNLPFFKEDPSWINYISKNYKVMYNYLCVLDKCNNYWTKGSKHINTTSGGYYLVIRFIKNIIENKKVFDKDMDIPWIMDSDNIISNIKILSENGVNQIPDTLLLCPYIEIKAIINYMIKKGIPVAINGKINNEFIDIKNKNSNPNVAFINYPLLDDSFMISNGFKKYKEGIYSFKPDSVSFATITSDKCTLPKKKK